MYVSWVNRHCLIVQHQEQPCNPKNVLDSYEWNRLLDNSCCVNSDDLGLVMSLWITSCDPVLSFTMNWRSHGFCQHKGVFKKMSISRKQKINYGSTCSEQSTIIVVSLIKDIHSHEIRTSTSGMIDAWSGYRIKQILTMNDFMKRPETNTMDVSDNVWKKSDTILFLSTYTIPSIIGFDRCKGTQSIHYYFWGSL